MAGARNTRRHYLPGRVRLHVPDLCRKPALAETAVRWLRAQPGITAARLNEACASLVVEYRPAREPLLKELLAHLEALSAKQLTGLIAGAKRHRRRKAGDKTPAPPAKTPAKSGGPLTKGDVPGLFSARSPLNLPTLSLLMAFSANPFVVAVNMPLMVWNAIPIAKRAWRVWSNESRLNVDFLDTLAISASVLLHNPLAGSLVTWLIKLGDWIRDLTAAGSRRAIAGLLEFRSRNAWILRDGQITSIPAEELAVGDLVVVYPGEMIPVDGEIIEGTATIDQKTITGEGLPVTRTKGGAAFAATVIREGQLTIRAVRVGSDTTAGQIAHLVESAPMGDTRMQNHAELLADRLVAPTARPRRRHRRAERRLQPLPLARDRRLRHRNPRRRADLGAVLDDPCRPRRHRDQERRPHGEARQGRHHRVRQDRHPDPWRARPSSTSSAMPITSRPGHLLGLAAAAETRLHHPVAEALRTRAKELAGQHPALRRDPLPRRPRRRRPGQRLLRPCRQRALHAPDRDINVGCRRRSTAPRSIATAIRASTSRSTASSAASSPMPTRCGRKAAP